MPRREAVSVPAALPVEAEQPPAAAAEAVLQSHATGAGAWASPYEDSPPFTAISVDLSMATGLGSTEAAFLSLDAAAATPFTAVSVDMGMATGLVGTEAAFLALDQAASAVYAPFVVPTATAPFVLPAAAVCAPFVVPTAAAPFVPPAVAVLAPHAGVLAVDTPV